MTWKEIKQQIEAQGIKDENEISYIDWHEINILGRYDDEFQIIVCKETHENTWYIH